MFECAVAVEDRVTGLRSIKAPRTALLFRAVTRTRVAENLRERDFVIGKLKIEIEPRRSPELFRPGPSAAAVQQGEIVVRESL